MVISEDEQTVLPQHPAAFSKNSAQFRRELLGTGILNFFGMTRGRALADKWWRAKLLPCKKEVRQFRVMHVVEERRVGHDEVNTGIGQTGRSRTAAGKINGSGCRLRRRWPLRFYMARERGASAENTLAVAPAIRSLDLQLKWR